MKEKKNNKWENSLHCTAVLLNGFGRRWCGGSAGLGGYGISEGDATRTRDGGMDERINVGMWRRGRDAMDR